MPNGEYSPRSPLFHSVKSYELLIPESVPLMDLFTDEIGASNYATCVQHYLLSGPYRNGPGLLDQLGWSGTVLLICRLARRAILRAKYGFNMAVQNVSRRQGVCVRRVSALGVSPSHFGVM